VVLGQAYARPDFRTATPGRLLPAVCVTGAVLSPADHGDRAWETSLAPITPPAPWEVTSSLPPAEAQELEAILRFDARTSISGGQAWVRAASFLFGSQQPVAGAGPCGDAFVNVLAPHRRFAYAFVVRWPDAATREQFVAVASTNSGLFLEDRQAAARALARTAGATLALVVYADGFGEEAMGTLRDTLASTRCSVDDFDACGQTLASLQTFLRVQPFAHAEDALSYPGFGGTWTAAALGTINNLW
jgi:hypothetical protein